MFHDLYGNAVSLTDPAALDSWNALQPAFLSHAAAAPGHLGDTLARAPDFALGQAVRGLFMLMMARRELVATAHDALAAARSGAGTTPREAAFVAALADWLDGAPERAAARLEDVLDTHPGDALALKIAHGIRFILGQTGAMLAATDKVMPTYGPDHPACGYMLGCRAFALEESGRYRCAQAAGEEALALAPDDAWGLHAVAHVHDMTGDSRGGLDWLARHETGWAHCNNFRYHVWWHKALLHLDLGETDAALALYDAKIRAEHTDDYRDIANAASLLMRLDLEGVATGPRWEELAALAEARSGDGCLVFADLHYLMALVGAGRAVPAETLARRIAADGRGAGTGAACFADPGTAAAEGLAAFGAGAWARAFDRLAAARPTLQRAGGSHAQRDVFERLAIDAGIRAGRLEDARQMLEARTARRGGRPDGYARRRAERIAHLQKAPAA